MNIAAVIISIVSALISVFIFYLLYIRKGEVQLTQPTIVIFRNCPSDGKKIILRALAFNTAVKGQIIETLYLNVQNNNVVQDFQFWGYGETENTGRGSGLYVSQEGCALYHHFSLIPKDMIFNFLPGDYKIEVFASIFGKKVNEKMAVVDLSLTDESCHQLKENQAEVWFHLDGRSRKYFSTLEKVSQRNFW